VYSLLITKCPALQVLGLLHFRGVSQVINEMDISPVALLQQVKLLVMCSTLTVQHAWG